MIVKIMGNHGNPQKENQGGFHGKLWESPENDIKEAQQRGNQRIE